MNDTALTTGPASDADITAALRAAGALEENTSSFNRAKLDGSTIMLGDEPFIGTKNKPALTVRIAAPPTEYQAFWFDEEAAARANREGMSGFCKSFFDIPEQARKYSTDGHSCDACPFHPFNRDEPKRCQWKGDIAFQHLLDPGTDKAQLDDTLWTLSLSTTSMIEWKGTGREPVKGAVGDANFMHQLGRYALNNSLTVPDAMVALAHGRVIADIRVLRAASPDGARTWSVISFSPVSILEAETNPQLASGITDEDIEDLGF